MGTEAIAVTQLSREFRVPERSDGKWWRALIGKMKPIQALNGVSFSMRQGEKAALVGKNGSGKSTLVKILTGVVHPTAGHATVLGHIPWKRRRDYLRQIGVMFGQKSLLFPDLTVMDALRLYRIIYEMPEDKFSASIKRLDDYLSVSRLLDRPVRKLSLGERMRCEVVAAIVHRPAIMFLDEPTIGMDVETRNGLAAYLGGHLGVDQTLILTTHDLGLIQGICSRILIMNSGQLIHDLPASDLASVGNRVRLQVKYRRVDNGELLDLVLASVKVVERREGALVVDVAASHEDAVKKQLGQALDLISLATQEAPLEAMLESLLAPSREVAVSRGGESL